MTELWRRLQDKQGKLHMLIALALMVFGLGVLWYCGRLSCSFRRTGPVRRLFEAVVGASLFALAAAIALKGGVHLPVGLWTVVSLVPVFYLFIDSVHSALRFHAEDTGSDH